MGAFTAVTNDYLRRELGVDNEHEYIVFSYKAIQSWKWNQKDRKGYTNAADELRKTLTANPHLRVLIANGIYDLATPFFASEYTADHLKMRVPEPGHIQVRNYPAGHMMYFHPGSLEGLTADMRAFLRGDKLD